MYTQKYPRLVNLLPNCRKSVFLKSLKWFQNQLKRVPGYSTYTIVNPWFRVWGWDYDRGENKSHVFVPEDKTLVWAVIIRAPAHVCCTALHSVTQACPTLCDPLGCSPPGSSVHGNFFARILEWVSIFYFRGSSQASDRTHVSSISCVVGGFVTGWVVGKALLIHKVTFWQGHYF